MILLEFDSSPVDYSKLVALSQFLLGRAQDTDAQKKISVQSFINLAHSLGISITEDQLINLVQKPPLNGVIQNVANGEVVFKGGEQVADTMTVDQAQQTVDSMAKRAAKKGL
jgi:hypothetical protein